MISQGFDDTTMTITYQNVNPSDTTVNASTSNIKIAFSRSVFTNDGFDVVIGTPLSFCIYFIKSGNLNGSA